MKIQPQKIGLYKIIDIRTLVTYKLEDFSGKQITRHRSNIVLYYLNELFVQEQIQKHVLDNSLLRLHPKKPNIAKSKSVSFSLDNPDIPSDNQPSPYHLVLCPKYQKTTLKTTIQETPGFEDNR